MPNNPWLTHCPGPRRPRPDNLRYDVFLSYRSVNRRWTFALYDTLVEAGFDVFVDQVELKPGGSLRRQLQASLEASASGVLVWSADAANSDWVEEEFHAMDGLVKDRRSTDFPFFRVIAKLDPTDLPLFARDSLWTDFHEHPQGPTGGELLRLFCGLVGESLGDRARLVLEIDEQTKDLINQVEAARLNGDAAQLVELADVDALAVSATPLILCHVAESLIGLKEEQLGLGVLATARETFPKAVRPVQLEGLAHRRLGDYQQAQRVLGPLYAAGHRDPETMGMYAATWAQRYEEEEDINLLRRSQQLYEEAFELEPTSSYVGVNAAAKAALLGDAEKARALAERVGALEEVSSATSGDSYWEIATHAEVRLLEGAYERAAELYAAAVAGSPTAKGNHGTTLEQLSKLIDALGVPAEQARQLRAPFGGD